MTQEASVLPEGWAMTRIADVCTINPAKPPPDALPSDALVSFIPMPAVDKNSGAISKPEQRPFGEVRKGFTSFQDGDVLFAKITPCMENGKAAIAKELTNGVGFGSTEFHVMRPATAVNAEYLHRFIRQETFRRAAQENMTGSVGQARVPVDFVATSGLPLPPLAEQKRIVAQIETVLVSVNAARERLAKVPKILKRFRQSVLAAACSGRLTEDWRAQQKDLEMASCLLKRIREERREALGSKYREPVAPDECELPEVPDEWCITSLGNLSKVMQYGTSEKSGSSSTIGIPVLRMGNIQDGRLSLSDLKYMDRTKEVDAFRLKQDDLLFNRTNSPELVGKSAVFDSHIECVFASYLIRVEFIKSVASSKYACYWLGSLWGRKWAQMVKTDGVSQSNINATKLSAMPIPVPMIDEQQEIVRRVEALFRLADIMEKRVEVARQRADKLTQAVLARAFRGELVPTEAELARQEGRDYEPASVLLERIQQDRAQAEPKQRKGRQKEQKTLAL